MNLIFCPHIIPISCYRIYTELKYEYDPKGVPPKYCNKSVLQIDSGF